MSSRAGSHGLIHEKTLLTARSAQQSCSSSSLCTTFESSFKSPRKMVRWLEDDDTIARKKLSWDILGGKKLSWNILGGQSVHTCCQYTSAALVGWSCNKLPNNQSYYLATLSPTTGKCPALLIPASCCQGLEFAAQGNTADPCFLLRVGQRKSKKSKPIADVLGGPGGRCYWPCQGYVMTNVRDADVRSSGFEVKSQQVHCLSI